MRSSFVSALLAFTSVVCAANPTADFDPISVPSAAIDTVDAGSAYTIKWTSTPKYAGTVTITLLQGPSTSLLNLGDVIETKVENSLNQYVWDIPEDIESFAFYGIQISWDSDSTVFQWSFPFHIKTTASGVSSASGSALATGAATGSVGPISTKTVTLSIGTAYTATTKLSSTTSASASTVTNSTLTTATSAASAGAPSAVTTTSNGTLSTSASLTPSASRTGAASGTSRTPSSVASSGAVANLAKGSFAVIGGAVLAFAL